MSRKNILLNSNFCQGRLYLRIRTSGKKIENEDYTCDMSRKQPTLGGLIMMSRRSCGRKANQMNKWHQTKVYLSFFLTRISIFVTKFFFRLNCSFNPLIFTKLRFWPPKKKNYKTAP